MSNKKRTKNNHSNEDEKIENDSKKRKVLDNFEFENDEENKTSTTEVLPEIKNEEINGEEKKKKFSQTEIQQLKETEILFKSSFFRLAVKKIFYKIPNFFFFSSRKF